MNEELKDNSSRKILKLGDKWPEHYRGTKYHFDSEGHVWWHLPHIDQRIYAKRGHGVIGEELLKVRSEGGSFRITECGDILSKKKNENDWEPMYICEMDGPLIFPDVENTADSLNPGDLWRGFYDGARYTFCEKKIWWKNPELDTRQFTNEMLPVEILKELTFLKPKGGQFRVTENGHLITLIPPQPLPADLKKQYESLSNVQKQIIETKVKTTKMLPVYVGDFFEGFTLQPVRRLTDPLSKEEIDKMFTFLNQYKSQTEEEVIAKDFDDDVEEDWP